MSSIKIKNLLYKRVDDLTSTQKISMSNIKSQVAILY